MSTSPKADANCPLCRRPAAPEFAPFCSRRCADRDLINWLGEAYAVPADPVEEELDSE